MRRAYIPPHRRQVFTPRLAPRDSFRPDRPAARTPSRRYDPLRADLGERLRTIDLEGPNSTEDLTFTDVEAAGGYKWVEGNGPTIAVPGQSILANHGGTDSVQGVPDLGVGDCTHIGQVPPDDQPEGNKEWADCK